MSESPLDKPFLKEDGTQHTYKGKPLTVREFTELTAWEQSQVVKDFSHSDETRAKLREAKQNVSDDTRAKISAANKGKPAHNKDTPHSVVTRAKISAANKGRVVSVETKAKISAANKGKVVSVETRTKLIAAKKVRTPEQIAIAKAKQSESMKARWAAKKAAKESQ